MEFSSDGAVLVDGAALELPVGAITYLGDGRLLSREARGALQMLSAFDGQAAQALVTWTPRPGARGDLSIGLPDGWAGEIVGMLGNFDGNPRNDLVSSGGIDVTSSLGFGASDALYLQRLYATFGASWRVSDVSSLFTYADGKSTEDYYDPGYPRGVTTLGDLSPADYSRARDVCLSAGLSEGLGLDDCIADVGFSGDASFADSLASSPSFGLGLGDAMLGDTPLSVGFNGEIPPNFYPGRLRAEADGSNLAGLYGANDHYSFYLNDLSGHSSLTVVAAVVSDVPISSSTVELVLDGTVVRGAVREDSERSVQLASGATLYGATVVFGRLHSAPDVLARLRIASDGGATTLGVGRVEVDMHRVPYELFELEMQPGVEVRPAAMAGTSGAGRLEAAGSSDRYCFAAPEGASLIVDGSRLTHEMAWRLTSIGGTFAAVSGQRGPAIRVDGIGGRACVEVYEGGPTAPGWMDLRPPDGCRAGGAGVRGGSVGCGLGGVAGVG